MTGMFREFQEFRKILCICPSCGNLVRVSDLHLKVKGPTVRTWLDDYEKLSLALEKKEERFEEMEGKFRETARQKGRKKAKKVFNKAISPTFKAFKFDPFDIKPILNPIDFIVFKDMNKLKSVSNIIFLSKKCSNQSLTSIRCDVKKAIVKKKYGWQVARIDFEGCLSFE